MRKVAHHDIKIIIIIMVSGRTSLLMVLCSSKGREKKVKAKRKEPVSWLVKALKSRIPDITNLSLKLSTFR